MKEVAGVAEIHGGQPPHLSVLCEEQEGDHVSGHQTGTVSEI